MACGLHLRHLPDKRDRVSRFVLHRVALPQQDVAHAQRGRVQRAPPRPSTRIDGVIRYVCCPVAVRTVTVSALP